MSSKKNKKGQYFRGLGKHLKHIFSDLIFVYKNFFHWGISKLCISAWSLFLGILSVVPILLFAIIIGIVDPIDWLSLIQYILQDQDPTLQIMANVGEHPYWLGFMAFLAVTGILFFLMTSMYWLLLMTRLSLKYIERKRLHLKKNLYFSRIHITTFISLLSWMIVYLLVPIFFWCILVVLVFTSYNIGIVAFETLSLSILVISLILAVVLLYMIYRMLFSIILLAEHKKEEKIYGAREYLKKSIKITKGKPFLIFLCIFGLYVIVITPFNTIEVSMERKIEHMKDAFAYKTGLVENIDSDRMKYYEYVNMRYEDYSNEELVDMVVTTSRYRFFYAILLYFVFGGLFMLTASSFYVNVLKEK